jgi:hypothetical protein
MERVARGAAFRTMRAPMLMASGAVVCIFAAELLPDNSRLMVPTLELVVLLTAGFISISTHSLVAAVMAARARQRVSS